MKKKEAEVELTLDMDAILELATMVEQHIPAPVQEPRRNTKKETYESYDEDRLINCLRNEIVEVKFVPQPGSITDTKHVMYGGLSENSRIIISVPRLRNGAFVDVLTKAEKEYLEYVMGLEKGAMNVYNKENNFWDNNSEDGVSKVILQKRDNKLDLSDPIQYIQYKILLANKDLVAPSLHVLLDRPKATYRFVIVADNDVAASAKEKMSIKKQCYMEFGKIENNEEVLRAIIEILTSRPLDSNTKLDYLQTKAGELIDSDSKMFLKVAKDPLLPTRILIKKCVEQGFISRRGDYYYLRSDNTPLCEGGLEPTLNRAAAYLSNPKRQEMKLSLEAQVK